MTKDEATKIIAQTWINEHQVLLQALSVYLMPEPTTNDTRAIPDPPSSEPEKPSKSGD